MKPALPSSVQGEFPPIADYAFLSDCETTALVAPGGNIEWLCLPRMDSPSVFGSILDRAAGSFRVGPATVQVPAARRYIPGTMVLETSWWTPDGWLIVTDALLIGPWHHENERSGTHRRAPTDYDADHVLLRTIRCVNGQVQVRMDCAPMFDYGRSAAEWEYSGDGYHEALATGEGSDLKLRLTTDMNVGFEGPAATARTLLKADECRYVALSWSEHDAPKTFAEARDRMHWTSHHWQHWLDRGRFPDHEWRGYLQRSALTLKGLTFAPTGAIAAAATTSLPETPGGERNWDYRYAWIRDSTFTLWALYTLGFDWEANDFFYYVADLAEEDRGELQIMYGVGAERALDESTLDHLSGYEGAQPVRIGNAAFEQRQHDLWGAVVASIHLFTRSRDGLDDRLWGIVIDQVERALKHWREPDQGVWEVRSGAKHFTSSKVACWMAADCRRPAGADARRPRPGHPLAGGGRRDPGRRPRARAGRARRVHPALRHQGAGRVGAADPAGRVPAAVRRAGEGHRAGDRGRTDRARPGAAVPDRAHRGRAVRRGGHVHDLLVLAGLGARADR